MTAWHEQPYQGGGPAKVKGFPRPLYPPDAEQYGKTPSSRGPDVVAYKRTICRLGRWGAWLPSSWDDGYWTSFAHGTEGHDVLNSGVAGFQYQQRIDATGWLGKKTFDDLRYALVPDDPSFPHAGENAMDGVACNLINAAWDLFQGKEATSPAQTVRQAALARAKSQLGYVEGAGNVTKYGDWYGMNGQPWCAIFATWAFETNEVGPSPSFVRASRYAYVPYIVGDARNARYGLKTTDDPQPGDLVCYDWAYDSEYDHIGIFEKWIGGGSFYAIEGNTSTSSNSNGGEVMRRSRSRSGQGTVFVRVAEP